jgi:hypothetical protein
LDRRRDLLSRQVRSVVGVGCPSGYGQVWGTAPGTGGKRALRDPARRT